MPSLAVARVVGSVVPDGFLLVLKSLHTLPNRPEISILLHRQEFICMRLNKARILLITMFAAWALMTGTGLGVLWNYANVPGRTAAPPARWPSDSRVRPAIDRATLVMLAHPHCPCSRASVGELDKLMAQAPGRVSAYVFFLKPEGTSDEWEKTDLWQSAARIPGVNVVVDEGGREAKRFHAVTSGQTALYDVAGRLLFSGGITSARGHAGDNAGRSAIVSILRNRDAARAETDGELEAKRATGGEGQATETLVFGCPLDRSSDCAEATHEGHQH